MLAIIPKNKEKLQASAIDAATQGNDSWLKLLLGLPYGQSIRFFHRIQRIVFYTKHSLFWNVVRSHITAHSTEALKAQLQSKLPIILSSLKEQTSIIDLDGSTLLCSGNNSHSLLTAKLYWEIAAKNEEKKLTTQIEKLKVIEQTVTEYNKIVEDQVKSTSEAIKNFKIAYENELIDEIYELFEGADSSIPAEFYQKYQLFTTETEKKDFVKKIFGSIEINTVNDKKESLLYIALKNENFDLAVQLIYAGANLFKETVDQDTPIHFAISQNNMHVIDAIAKVLSLGKQIPDINAYNGQSQTILHLIMLHKIDILVEPAIAAGANLYARDDKNATPAGIAFQTNYQYGIEFVHFAQKMQIQDNPCVTINTQNALVLRSSTDPGIIWLKNVYEDITKFHQENYLSPNVYRLLFKPNPGLGNEIAVLLKKFRPAMYAAQPSMVIKELQAFYENCNRSTDSSFREMGVILKKPLENYEVTQKSREPASPLKMRLKTAEALAARNAQYVTEVGSQIGELRKRLDFLEQPSNNGLPQNK
jgi:hypothetical protein